MAPKNRPAHMLREFGGIRFASGWIRSLREIEATRIGGDQGRNALTQVRNEPDWAPECCASGSFPAHAVLVAPVQTTAKAQYVPP
jgi:hypothetical protein